MILTDIEKYAINIDNVHYITTDQKTVIETVEKFLKRDSKKLVIIKE